VFAAAFAGAGIGYFRPSLGDEPFTLSHHHLGTTRMHASPRCGVVDAECKVHGLGNLFVAGSSVFPTGGYANPTLTIVALAIRLADHLRARLSRLPETIVVRRPAPQGAVA
jgi:choline dehydrogenase-like flavoprotein